MFSKIFILLLLIISSLNAETKYKAKIGCIVPGVEVDYSLCIKSIELNGRIESEYNLAQYRGEQFINKNLPEHFNLIVRPIGKYKYFVKITNNNGEEVFYDEKANRYSTIKVGN